MNNLKFVIAKSDDLNEEEKGILIDVYRKLFKKMYDNDTVDSYLKATNKDAKAIGEKVSFVTSLARYYQRSIDIMNSIKEGNIELFLIYMDDNMLLGGGRLYKISPTEASVPDIAIIDLPLSVRRHVWKEAVMYAEDYYTKEGYTKMYLEIPISEENLLSKASKMGFQEAPEDIKEGARTYLLNKSLERTKNVEPNHSR